MAEGRKTEFFDGAKAGLPVMLAAAPFGALFGTLAINNGLTVGEAVLMSATIFGGASQMVGIELFGQEVAPWLIVLSIFAVNFRHVLYSASSGRRMAGWPPLKRAIGFFFLTDPQYAEAERRHENRRPVTPVWYFGMALPLYVSFVMLSWLGAVFGRLIADPEAFGLDYLLPIYFLSLVMAFRKRPLWLPVVAASAAASIVAYQTVGSPWHVSIGAVAGVLVAAVAPISGGEGAR
ncbi:MAG: AzlC family ABC transporter permease [Rhizobiaceae bacterium]